MLRNICNSWKLRSNCRSSLLHDLKSINHLSLIRLCSSTAAHIVQMRGLDYEAKEGDVIDFFKTLGITPKAVYLKSDASGRTSAVSEVEFATHAEAVIAMRKKNAFMGNRFIRLTLKSSDVSQEPKKVFQAENDDGAQTTKDLNISPLPAGHTLKMKNVPRRLSDQAIYEFFSPVGVTPISIKPKYNESGIRIGEFDVQFLSKEDAYRAMVKNNTNIGNKFIELSFEQS